jgi:gliding motility-associated-like protein
LVTVCGRAPLHRIEIGSIMRVRQYLIAFFITLIFLSKGTIGFASHVYGGDLLYKHISGATYEVTLTLYGDCTSQVFPTLAGSVPKIFIYNGNSFYEKINLAILDSGLEVSPVCANMMSQTSCKGGQLPGVVRFIYRGQVDLPEKSANWRFIFSGDLTVSQAGRSQNITNAEASTMQIEARLNNLSEENSSPQYTNIPTPFYCLLPDQQYNQGAIDTDGDSLAFELVPAMHAGNVSNPLLSTPVTYFPPYTGKAPLSTQPGEFLFSGLNGQLTFTPATVQNALLVCQVYEYRHSVLVGTSQREISFLVSADCQGTPPTLKIENVTGGAITGKNVVNICVGTPSVSFGISVANPDKDTTRITPRNVPETAILNVVQNNTPSPSIAFSWNTASLPPGVYTFFLDVNNDHCPIANRQTMAYTINITPFPTIAATPVLPTNCVHQALVQYDLTLGYIPRNITVEDGAGFLLTYVDTTGQVIDSLPVGNYTVTASCSPLCAVTQTLSIVDSGTLPLSAMQSLLCQRDPELPLGFPTEGPDAVVIWYDANNNVLSGPPTPQTDVPATFNWYVTEHFKVCSSEKAPIEVIVHPLPTPEILSNPPTTCFGDTVYLEASGGIQYTWSPEERIQSSTDGRLFTRLTNPGLFTVMAYNEFGCMDSSSITFNNIEPCCQFSFPSAFTPNGDGKNDGFKVVTYGNMRNYRLAIYNRWGQIVFLTFDPGQYWDGTHYGTPCDIGTYYYYFNGTCLSNDKEQQQRGDVTLIR